MDRRGFLRGLGVIGGMAALSPLAPFASFCPAPKLPSPVITADSFLKAGDVFTIEGVFAVNPATGRQSSALQRFIVTHVNDSVGLVPA